jgi:hypothetical protein
VKRRSSDAAVAADDRPYCTPDDGSRGRRRRIVVATVEDVLDDLSDVGNGAIPVRFVGG